MQDHPHYLIYKTTNLLNGKIYIGQHATFNLNDGYIGSGKRLRRAIKKYGKANLSCEILFECDSRESMRRIEREIVTVEFCRRDDTYNICVGGQDGGGFEYLNAAGLNGSALGVEAAAKHHADPEWKANWYRRFREGIANGRSWHPETIRKRKETIQSRFPNGIPGFSDGPGRPHTEESKRKIAEAHKGRYDGEKNPMFGKAWVSNAAGATLIDATDLDSYIANGFIRGKTSYQRNVVKEQRQKSPRQSPYSSPESIETLKIERKPLYDRYLSGESLRTIAEGLSFSYRKLHNDFIRCGWDTKK